MNSYGRLVARSPSNPEQERKHQGAESVAVCEGIVIGLLCYQNITASCILHKILNTDGHIWTNLFITALNNTDMTELRKYITSRWRYVRDGAS